MPPVRSLQVHARDHGILFDVISGLLVRASAEADLHPGNSGTERPWPGSRFWGRRSHPQLFWWPTMP